MRIVIKVTILLITFILVTNAGYAFPVKISANGCVNKTIDLDEKINYKLKFLVKLGNDLYPVKHVFLLFNLKKQVTGFKNNIRILNNLDNPVFENKTIIMQAISIYNTILENDKTTFSDILNYVSGISEKKPVNIIKKYYLFKIRKKLFPLVKDYVKKQTVEQTIYYRSKLVFWECRLYSMISFFASENDWLNVFTDLIVNRVYMDLLKNKNLGFSQYNILLRTDTLERFIEISKYSQQLKLFNEKNFNVNLSKMDIKKIERLIFHFILYSVEPRDIIKRFKNSIGRDFVSAGKRDMKANYINNLSIILKNLNCYASVEFYPEVQEDDNYYIFCSPYFKNRKISVYRNGELIFIKRSRFRSLILDRDLISDKDILIFVENNKEIIYIFSPYYLNQNLGKILLRFFSK